MTTKQRSELIDYIFKCNSLSKLTEMLELKYDWIINEQIHWRRKILMGIDYSAYLEINRKKYDM